MADNARTKSGTSAPGSQLDFAAPEAVNREQDEVQAQSVTEDALDIADNQLFVGESESAPSAKIGSVVPEDAQDVVDHMSQMERSGIIDYDAFRGERSDDDEVSTFGNREDEDRTTRLSDE